MNKTQHPSNNRVLGAPKGWDQDALECGALPITDVELQSGHAMVSYWTPTAAEIEKLKSGSMVALWVFGGMHPPVAVEVV